MVNIFEFRNYRDYLKKCYEERKRKNALYSYQAFSRDMNFNNKGFLFNVLKGKKNLSGAHCYTISKILEHTKEQAEYFEKIVAFTQARNEELRTNLLEKIQEKSTIKSIPPHIFGKERHEYLSQWYHSAVRALIDIVPISDNYELISQRLFRLIFSRLRRRKNQSNCSNALILSVKAPTARFASQEKIFGQAMNYRTSTANGFTVKSRNWRNNRLSVRIPTCILFHRLQWVYRRRRMTLSMKRR